MPTVAQTLQAFPPRAPGGRFELATVTALQAANGATVTLAAGGAEIPCLVALDVRPAVGALVLVVLTSAANVVLARLEL